MSLLKSRIAAVAVGTTVLAALGTTSAFAAAQVTSATIKNFTITSADLASGSVTSAKIKNGTISRTDLDANLRAQLASAGQPGLNGKDAVFAPFQASLAAPKTIANIGGPINSNNTNLETGFTLPAGKYLINVSGAFMSSAASATPDVDIYPQLSLWLDKNGDNAFTWQDEGDISPNALMPDAANRHISASGTTIVTLDAETEVGLFGFGYASDQSSKRSGEIDVVNAVITATPIG